MTLLTNLERNKIMPISECDNCGGSYEWQWEEAFNKFGLNNGDGQIET